MNPVTDPGHPQRAAAAHHAARLASILTEQGERTYEARVEATRLSDALAAWGAAVQEAQEPLRAP